MFVEGGPLQLGQVECDGRGRVLVLAEQVMAGEVVLGEGDELWRGGGAFAGEDLLVDMAGEVLDPYLAEAGFGRDCRRLVRAGWRGRRGREPARVSFRAALRSSPDVACAVARHRRDAHWREGLAAAGESRGRLTRWATACRREQRMVVVIGRQASRHLMPSGVGGRLGAYGRRWLASWMLD